jgi:anaerobic selenocysteine-containing dehydrogenase
MPFLYEHAGYKEIWDRREWHDPAVPRSTADYLEESVAKGWIPIRPRRGVDPKVFLFTGANPLRRWPSPQTALAHLWPKLDLVVDVNFKVGTSGMRADLILPTAGYYERDSLKYSQAYLPYLVLCERVIPPLGEAKPEWEIFGLLARRIQDQATKRGVGEVEDAVGGRVDLRTVYERWSGGGRFHESDPRGALDHMLRRTTTTGSKGLDDPETRGGMLPVVEAGGGPDALYAVASDFSPGRTLYPHARFVEGKEAWPTLSGRQQFLIDHPWYEEIGETLPVFKEAPKAGGDYPIRLTGGHTRWSIHAAWRDDRLMLQQQRGQPVMYMSARDAAERGVRDGARVRVWNDLAAFEVMAKVSPALRPGQLILYHAWENFQFAGQRGFQNLVPSPLNPVELAGGQFHLRPMTICLQPSHTDRDTRVEVALA